MKEFVGLRTPEPPEPRTVQLALVGLGRTGSTSFVAALQTLGYAPIHDDQRSEVADVYEQMMSGELDLDQVNAVLGQRGFDAPMISTHAYVKWAATAPNVKVILTVRDNPQKWAESWLAVAAPVAFLPNQRPFKWLHIFQQLAAWHYETVVHVPTNGHPEFYNNKDALMAGYEAWIDFVRKTVPADRLLEFNVKEGWEPLCAFLEKDIPNAKFPHINDRVVVDSVVKVMVAILWVWPCFLAPPFAMLWYCCFGTSRSGGKRKLE